MFQGVTQPVNTIDDFAAALANHPAVAGAWAQKLCYQFRSAPCDVDDAEFQRVVDDFSNSGSWSALVHDLAMTSMMTNLSPSKTYATYGEVLAVSRRDPFCAALDFRLKLNDACKKTAVLPGTGSVTGIGKVPAIAAGLPSDGYGRGSTSPVLPNNPTLFSVAAVENICAGVSQQLIDAAPNVNQPDALHWSSAQADAALDDFTTLLMGIPKADADFAQVRAALQKHYTDAQQTASKTDSLRSAFVTACMSPTFSGVGL